jgi:hypothetical protein
MRNRWFRLLVLSSLCFYSVGCSNRAQQAKTQEAIQWLKKCPPAPDLPNITPFGVVPYSSHEEWVNAGRRIEGLEEVLIDLATIYRSEMAQMNMHDWFIIYCVGVVGSPNSVPPLVQIMEDRDRDFWTRQSAVLALGEIGDGSAVEPLCRILSATKPDSWSTETFSLFKRNVIYALGMIGERKAIPFIEGALKDHQFSQSLNDHQFARDRILEILEELRRK